MMRAESEQVTTAGTSWNAGGIIVSIRVRLRARHFKNPGICCGLARLRVSEIARAAVPGGVERKASTLARYHSLLVVWTNLKPDRAHQVQVAHTSGIATFPYKNFFFYKNVFLLSFAKNWNPIIKHQLEQTHKDNLCTIRVFIFV